MLLRLFPLQGDLFHWHGEYFQFLALFSLVFERRHSASFMQSGKRAPSHAPRYSNTHPPRKREAYLVRDVNDAIDVFASLSQISAKEKIVAGSHLGERRLIWSMR